MAAQTETAKTSLPESATKELTMADPSMLITLKHGKADGVSCQMHKTGATVTSWKVDGVEAIFVSKEAKLDGTKAVRGGIPICFPAFGPWEFGAQHGFARSSNKWKMEMPPAADESTGNVTTVWSLSDDEETRKTWDFGFKLTYTVRLTARSLILELDVQNTDEKKDLTFTCALHTYYSVPDVAKVEVTNMKGLTYVDKTDDMKEKKEEGDVIKITGFTDRVYSNAPEKCELRGLQNGRALILSKVKKIILIVFIS